MLFLLFTLYSYLSLDARARTRRGRSTSSRARRAPRPAAAARHASSRSVESAWSCGGHGATASNMVERIYKTRTHGKARQRASPQLVRTRADERRADGMIPTRQAAQRSRRPHKLSSQDAQHASEDTILHNHTHTGHAVLDRRRYPHTHGSLPCLQGETLASALLQSSLNLAHDGHIGAFPCGAEFRILCHLTEGARSNAAPGEVRQGV